MKSIDSVATRDDEASGAMMDVPKRIASAAFPQQRWEPPEPRREGQALVVLGLGLGTMLEWYDFQLYSGFSSVIMPQFFPESNEVAQALSYWLVFAVAFITRPLGAVIFGHIADGAGRKRSLLISLLAMGLPTVFIGCLPSYQVIGIAAPILLAVLRAVQGLAVGGEYGTAIVYIFELAPPGWEGRQSSFVVALCNVGVLLGNLMVMLLVGVCQPDQLRIWAWRIPFLLVVVTVALAYFLRLHMPDTVQLLAAATLASEAASGGSAASRTAASCAMTSSPSLNDHDIAGTPGRDVSMGGARGGRLQGGTDDPKGVEEATAETRRRAPLGALLLHHPLALALHALVTAFSAAAFYSYTAWLPTHLAKLGVPLITTQVMLCTGLVALIAVVLLSGVACDRGIPICWTGIFIALGGAALPFALCAAADGLSRGGQQGSLAAPWVAQVLLMAWTAVALCLLPTVGVSIYPPQVRASGYNLGYSLAFGFVGGLSPMAVTAISSSQNAAASRYGVAFWVMAWGLASAGAFALVLWRYPACNRTAAMPLSASHRRPKEPGVAAELRALSMSLIALPAGGVGRGGDAFGSSSMKRRGPALPAVGAQGDGEA